MNISHRLRLRSAWPKPAAIVLALSLGAASLAQAQTATFVGSIGNFDIANTTGQDACGFEVDLKGAPPNTVPYGWSGNRFGLPTIACYSSATRVLSRWLVNDPANPGAYVAQDPALAIPFPYYYVQPAAVVGAAPVVVVVEVQAPEPPEAPQRFGNVQWMKSFVRQMPRTVTLEELLTDNPLVVPMDPAQLEVNWTVIQADPPAGGNGTRARSRNRNGSTLDATTRSVVRRFEMYAYTRASDPVTNEALCADLVCKVPVAGEVGAFISAQMAAVNVQGDFSSVAKTGSGGGNVESAERRITCCSKCSSPYTAGTVVTLAAKANSGSVFAGWTGACAARA